MSDDRDALNEQLGGAYQIVRELGRGAFATVYLARERVLHRLVAIKVLRLERAVSDEERERFMREARTAAHLDHPGIVPVLAFGETPTTMYMVMRYVGGESLADRLRREKRLPPDEVRRLLIDVASALAHAHRQGVVHRDIKPENVLLTSEGGDAGRPGETATRARLLDFGVAAFRTQDLGMNVSHETWGTPTFMSPEQALGEVDLDARSDIYSLGVMGYVMLAGRDPFSAASPFERVKQQQRGPAVPLVRAAPGAPAGLVAAIKRCLAYEPGERWRHTGDLVAALLALGDEPAVVRARVSGWRRGLARAVGAPSAARRRRDRRAAFFRSRPRPRLILEALRDDLRYTFRGLAKSPGFAAAVVLTFALGVGANATMFGVVDRLLLRAPAHVREPERVVRLAARQPTQTTGGQRTFSYPVYKAVREVQAFEAVAMTWSVGVPWGRGDRAQALDGLLASASYFPLLGVRPHLGRFILPEEDVEPVGAPVVVISHDFWMRHFAGDRAVIGRTLDLAQRRYAIVGVTPPGFSGTELSAPDVWMPITAAQGLQPGAGWATRGGSATWLSIFARLRPGVPPDGGSAETMRMMRAVAPDAFYVGPNRRIVAEPIMVSRAESAGVGARVTTLLAAMSALVLLIACANVINLLLARGLRRRREIAVRLALGITRGRLVGQLLAESVLLALLGGMAALLVAYWGGGLVRALLFGDITWADAPVDQRVLTFTMLLALTAGILAGLVPAVQTSRPELTSALKAGAREGGATRSRTRTALLVMQAALSIVLLVGTGLFVRSLGRISQIRLGVDVDRVLLGTMNLRATGRSPADADAVFARVLERARGLPGIQSAAVAATVPFSESFGVSVVVPGHEARSRDERTFGEGHFYNAVTPGYFTALGAPLLAGRDFGPADHAASGRVIIISERMAQRYWPGESAVGKCVRLGGDTMPCAQVIGVAPDVKRQGVFEEARSFVYAPLAQAPPDMTARRLVARPAGDDPARLIEPVRRAMQTAVPGLPYASVGLLRDMTNVRQQVRPWQLGASFFGAFGALALLLAAVGLYGVISYMVTQRTHEMGVRVALGAQARDVARLVIREGVGVTALGAVIGLAAALAGGRFVESLLYEVSARDPLVFAVVAVTLLAVAVAATLVPAWRAMRVDPVVALRAE